jgi:hypothetical protein
MAYGSVKTDFLVYSTITGDVTLSVSGISDSTVLAGIVDAATKNISTTGIISGHVYKVSGNVTVISGSGDIRPYGAYSFPTTSGSSGNVLTTNGNGTTAWGTTTAASIATVIALN